MDADRVREIIDRMSDDDLIAFATTCSNRGIALRAEIQLRKRYPVARNKSLKKLARKQEK